jgi:predicted phage tail protein
MTDQEKTAKLASQYLELWEKMKTDLLSRQGDIKMLSEKEKAVQASGGSLEDAARILEELEKKQKDMHDSSSDYFSDLRGIIHKVPNGYESDFWEMVSPIRKK